MYKYIESNASIIRMNRGDSFQAPLFINDGTYLKPIQYQIKNEDKVYFGVMEPGKLWEQSILKQTYTNEDELDKDGNLIIKITPGETEYLLPGTYYYMIKLAKYDQDNDVYYVKTIVPQTIFEIL